jgi:hypothetical protein
MLLTNRVSTFSQELPKVNLSRLLHSQKPRQLDFAAELGR